MVFEFFDRNEEFVVREGTLPHWYQPAVTYFVTFRTADSVPQALLRSWRSRRVEWLRRHSIDPQSPHWKKHLQANPEWERAYYRTFTHEFMDYLDRGYGQCVLAEGRIAQLVADSLQYFDGDRYHLGDFVVMPTHLHVLCSLIGQTEIETQCRSWKQFTAVAINKALGRTGRFWQSESFDHLVRSPEQFEYFQRYIADNPIKARLRRGQFLHRTRPK